MNINKLIKESHDNAVEKSFYDCGECCGEGYFEARSGDDAWPEENCKSCNGTGIDQNKNIPELLMLIVSELGESLESLRNNRRPIWELFQQEIDDGFKFEIAFENHIKDSFEDEISDVFIRLFDMVGYLNFDLEKHIKLKMQYNKTRPKKHGKEF